MKIPHHKKTNQKTNKQNLLCSPVLAGEPFGVAISVLNDIEGPLLPGGETVKSDRSSVNNVDDE